MYSFQSKIILLIIYVRFQNSCTLNYGIVEAKWNDKWSIAKKEKRACCKVVKFQVDSHSGASGDGDWWRKKFASLPIAYNHS